VENEVDRRLVGRQPDRPQHLLGVVDVDEPVEGHPEEPDRLLAMDHRDDAALPHPLDRGQGPCAPHLQQPTLERWQEEEEQEEVGEQRPDVHRRGTLYRRRTWLHSTPVDGWLDWYLLGVVVALVFAAAAVAIALLTLEWWAILVFVGAALVSGLAFRRLSPAARPLAALVAVGIALVPLLGYALVVAVPLAGARLGRRAETRYAGLRVLAKD
jgi:hypothetical protein